MTVSKLSISVPSEVEDLVKSGAAEKGQSVSQWMAEAARHWARSEAQRAEALAAAQEVLEEYEAEFGPLPQEAVERVDRFIAEHGLLEEGDDKRAAAG
jgi:hypothetical protein